MKTFLIIHGAWAGAWNWDRVVHSLQDAGARTHVPCLTGVGERAHLAGCGVTLDTHIEDVVAEATMHDLKELTLVAHSYGGFVALGAMERLVERVAALVFVEAFLPESGASFATMSGKTYDDELVRPPELSFGDYEDPATAAFVKDRVRPQPSGTFTTPVRHTGTWLNAPRKTYVIATGWDGPFAKISAPYRGKPDWSFHEVACGHDVPLAMPERLTEILLRA